MPARVVVVHDEQGFVNELAAAIRAAGFDTAPFTDPFAAITALSGGTRQLDLLVTAVRFAPGQPHGISLALMARNMQPGAKALFIGPQEDEEHTQNVGRLLPMPVTVLEVVTELQRMLGRQPMPLAGPDAAGTPRLRPALT